MDFRPIDPIQPLFRGDTAGGVGTAGDSREQGSLFADIFQAAVENVKETERVKNDAEYRLATGQMDNPAEMSIASSQWSMSVNLLIQLRNKALKIVGSSPITHPIMVTPSEWMVLFLCAPISSKVGCILFACQACLIQ